MNRRTKTLLISAMVLLPLASCSRCTRAPETPKPTHIQQEVQETRDEWTCAMHPRVRLKDPGLCPVCGMKLIRLARTSEDRDPRKAANPPRDSESEPPEGHSALQLALPDQQRIGVKTGIVESKTLFKSIRAPGRVAFDPELYTAQSEYQEALAQLGRVRNSPLPDVRHSAERMVESAKLRLKILGLSDKQIRDLGKKPQTEASLLLSKPGENVWVYAEIFEMDLPYVTPGLEAEITASFLQGRTLLGKVASVDRILNPNTRTAKVRIEVPKAKLLLRPETYVDATILAPLGKQLAVPFDAVFDTGREAWVFLAKPGGHFEPRRIQVKLRADDWVAVESGLQGGETIVTSANFLIDSESRLRGASLAPGPSATPSCPEGQAWDPGMAMCMPKAGGSGK